MLLTPWTTDHLDALAEIRVQPPSAFEDCGWENRRAATAVSANEPYSPSRFLEAFTLRVHPVPLDGGLVVEAGDPTPAFGFVLPLAAVGRSLETHLVFCGLRKAATFYAGPEVVCPTRSSDARLALSAIYLRLLKHSPEKHGAGSENVLAPLRRRQKSQTRNHALRQVPSILEFGGIMPGKGRLIHCDCERDTAYELLVGRKKILNGCDTERERTGSTILEEYRAST